MSENSTTTAVPGSLAKAAAKKATVKAAGVKPAVKAAPEKAPRKALQQSGKVKLRWVTVDEATGAKQGKADHITYDIDPSGDGKFKVTRVEGGKRKLLADGLSGLKAYQLGGSRPPWRSVVHRKSSYRTAIPLRNTVPSA